ncbi:MAG: hypothetical protein NTZ83_04475 [Candidatus Pacearchaeota archaeon]|nr:hypothetical protein [Candidatus Pacearchaeota archaeon]
MEGLTDILKKTVVGLGVVVLSYAPLNAQKAESDYMKKHNMDLCIAGKEIKPNSYYIDKAKEKEKKENSCFSKAAERYNNKLSRREEKEVLSSISKEEKIFHKQYKKMVKARL